MSMARPHCLDCERQAACRAFSRAWAKTGNKMAARIAMMAITTSSSIRVNAGLRARCIRVLLGSKDSCPGGALLLEQWTAIFGLELPSIRPGGHGVIAAWGSIH